MTHQRAQGVGAFELHTSPFGHQIETSREQIDT
ncbi:hypothetical protein RSal33209_0385 [Renibacterium salmoninarum ATCC 33209]|uniref:Uncharacterized protein n=1 Tax=Renibacterium salmoninarum (strain ATCC 33209 / DSM 20767 / JCM 11484 / NBRC 15589 / NCIMB 2235) TaxID=288705 RepID=A9WLV8_RENSM|nr:hypothetical protein RSal33209_0385 [Renibacterium salmoninarum ATCC 33209]